MRSFDSIPERQWIHISHRSGGKWLLPVRLDVQCPKPGCGRDLIQASVVWQEHDMLASGKVNCGKCSSTVYFAALFASKGKPESPVRPTTIVQWPESPSTAFPEAARVSPRFIAAHAEAERAHRLGLVELAGMGYRRALEVLVKDDAISRFPGSRETIEREALGSCIANRIDDPLVREAAKRLTWLGNDWAHYVRSWTQYDVDHMKTMLGMVAQFLMMRASLERLPEEMPAGKKPREAS